jgi:choline dehydrogenase
LSYDFVIVGGGSAASVAAMRLVRDGGFRVLMLERGPSRTNAIMEMPAGYMKYLARDDFLEMHETVPQPQLGGRAPIVPVGKVLGGGSSVNAMVYMRGQREDYDGWSAEIGNEGEWGYRDMLRHFTSLEDNSTFNDEYHGIGGGLRVANPGHIAGTTEDFLRAAQGLGHAYNPDFNGARQNGVGIMQHTYGQWGRYRRRSDAKKAFLDPLEKDERLTVVCEARVDRILVEGGRAIGVSYTQGGEARTAHAEREVLVGAGTYNTAKLLMLSGVGPAAHLREHGIAVVADLPVGQNLQDHHEVPVIATTREPSGYFGEDKGWPMLRNGLQYLLFNTGPVTTTGIEACLFYDPDGGERPTIQLYCAPIVYLDRDVSAAEPTWGVTFTSCLLRPRARGSVTLRSANPADQPLVDCNFFGHPDDLRLTTAALRTARQLLDTEPFRSKIAEELLPGAAVMADPQQLERFCGQTVKTNYHPVGTLRMGTDADPTAVVGPDLRVRGVDGLRVIDCSIMPQIVSGNTNAPAMAIGSKAASLVGATYG